MGFVASDPVPGPGQKIQGSASHYVLFKSRKHTSVASLFSESFLPPCLQMSEQQLGIPKDRSVPGSLLL